MDKTRPSRFKSDIRIKPSSSKRVVETVRPCSRPDCVKEGAHRVLRDRNVPGEYVWVCVQHAREHNEQFNYFAGMSDDEIQTFRIDALTGHRPTWPLGKRGADMRNGKGNPKLRGKVSGDTAEAPRAPERRLMRLQLMALETLSLEPTASFQEIKARYKELVKRFHPDLNGGDRGSEERLKQVIKAYGVLRASGMTS